MSLIRQVWLLLLATVLLAFVGSIAVATSSARELLQTQLRLKNSDNAASLALALSQQKGDAELMSLLMAAQFDTGYYRRVQLRSADGKLVFSRDADVPTGTAPAWFVSAVRITSQPGTAQVSDGWRALGQVLVESHVSYAHDALWSSTLRTAQTMALVGLLAAALGWAVVRRISRPLDQAVVQALALEKGEFVTVSEPPVPELQRLTRAMNSLVDRLRMTSRAQAAQLDALHRQVNGDTLTGLSNRSHFLFQLAASLEREDGPAEGGLVLLRVMELAALNRQFGHAATDRVLVTIAQSLQPYADEVKGCFLGRLNGSDFALCLPAPGVVHETAQTLAQALRLVLPTLGSGAAVCIGAVEVHRGMQAGQVMGSADAALARAESRGAFAVEFGVHPPGALAVLGEGAWRQRIEHALGRAERVWLMEFPVLDAQRRLLHLECPLRLQLEAEGAFEPAARWLPLAVRSRLTSAVDERALSLAINAADRDGRPRCVNLSPASLQDSGFAARVRALLWAKPQAARLISLEVAEVAAVEHFELLRELGRQLRSTGARFGIEHAGERLGQIPRLFEAGLDYLKLDAAVISGVGRDEHRALFVRSTVGLLHGLGIQVYAEGVADAIDAARLWDCGVDGATGPWISTLTVEP
ncbi:MAG: GGDEF domain-containing protein [Burkholderiales bacterium PBB1]|nr:MAG: GGDEF domain-containing protein [Burkholderiales bacterium PBB1]